MGAEPVEIDTAVERAAASAWAKAAPHGVPPEHWLPLWQHLDDTSDVAGLLWDHWLAPSARRLISQALPGGDADGRRLVTWLAGTHDVGKATPAFAIQVPVLANQMTRVGLHIGPMVHTDRAKLRHELASAVILDRWLRTRAGLSRFDTRQFTDVVAGHHGAYPTSRALVDADRAVDLMGDGLWREVQELLADRAAHRSGVVHRWPDWAEVSLSPATQMVVTGLVIMADWIASTEEYFPLLRVGDEPGPIRDGSESGGRRVDQAWRRLHLRRGWSPDPPPDVGRLFADRFPRLGGRPRPVQSAAARLATTMSAPGLMIVEAPMGEGKTEAAFMAAEVLAARTGASGCFVALPTQATSGAMFDRMLSWLERLPGSDGQSTQSMALVHGKAALNESFTSLPFDRATPLVHDESPSASTARGEERMRAVVHEWTRGRKRAALSDFVVGTIDQVLFAALVARHVMLRHLSLVTKVVVIDEVHAADVYMSRFLDRALEWLAAAGTPVVLLSATLPSSRRVELYRAYERGRRAFLGQESDADGSDPAGVLGGEIGYPSIVTTNEGGPQVEPLPPSGRAAEVIVGRLDDDLGALADLLEHELRDGGCAVVIRNTVRRVQETAEALVARLGADRVTVAHAQFVAVDRIAKDADLLHRFGLEAGPDRPSGHVVVASQVVEQSLDVDFDLMVSDLAPVDLVLQRLGRLHRHVREDRPERLRVARCYLTGVDWETEPPLPVRGSQAVYGRWPLFRSAVVLRPRWDRGTIRLPGDIPSLVEDAYEGTDCPPPWKDEIDRAWRKHQEDEARRRYTADTFALPQVGTPGSDLYGLSHGSAGLVDEDSPSGQGYVRDGGEAVEVVVVQRGADGVDRVPRWVDGGGGELPLRSAAVPYPQARLLARCTLRLPLALVHGGIVDQVIDELEQDWFEGWKQSPFLSGQLALVLDDERRRELAGHELTYDPNNGLVVRRIET